MDLTPEKCSRSCLWDPGFPFAPARVPFFYGWVIVVVGTLGIIASIPGQTMGVGVFTNILIEELGLTRFQLSTAYAIGTVLSGLTLPWMGKLFDRFGARRLIVCSAVATGLVLIFLSRCVWVTGRVAALGIGQIAAAFVVITVGFYLIRVSAQGVLTITSRNMIGKWFDYYRGTALALCGVVTAFTFSVSPQFLNYLIGEFGWQETWVFCGVFSAVVMTGIGWLFFRDNPEECGLVMDGAHRPAQGRKAHADSVTYRHYTRGEALRTWAFWAFNFSFAFHAFFSTAYTFHIVSLGQETGLSREGIISLFVPMSLASVVTNLFCGWVSSRTRLKYLLLAMNITGLIGVIGTIYLSTGWGKVAYVVGNGMCGGAFAALTGIVWPRFFGRRWLGAISGVGMASMVIASGIGPLVLSAAKSAARSYVPALWGCALVPALLCFASMWADNPQRKNS